MLHLKLKVIRYCMIYVLFISGATAPAGPGPPHSRDF
jgi:hypothetical protein